jgi:Flp pilus assembly protein TadD
MAENLLLKNGIAAYNEKRFNDALKYFKKCIDESKDKDHSLYDYYTGLTYTRMGDLKNAVDSLKKLIPVRLKPDMALQFRMVLGYIYALKENYQLSADIFRAVLKIQPENAQALSALGYVYYRSGENKEAVKVLKKALKIDKVNTNALNSLGYIYTFTEDKLDTAIKECEKALKLKPGYPAYLDSLGWAHYKTGNFGLARQYLSEAMEKIPDNPEVKEHFRDLIMREMTHKRRDKID